MSSVVHALLPVFALILLGYLARRSGRLGEGAARELNRFVVWLALPALLFRVTASAAGAELWQPGFVLAFGVGCVVVFGAVLAWRLRQRRNLADASLDALAAAYANTGYVGIPLLTLLLGEAALQPALVATLMVVCGLFGLAIVCIESALHAGQSFGRTLGKVGRALAGNPLVVAPLAGVLWNLTDVPLPLAIDRVLSLLGAATAPCALVCLGAFLAQPQPGVRQGAWPLVAAKLVVQPAITGVLAFFILELPPLWALSALLLSALPTGTGPFMLAEHYQRDAALSARVVLLSTLGALFSLSLALTLLGG